MKEECIRLYYKSILKKVYFMKSGGAQFSIFLLNKDNLMTAKNYTAPLLRKIGRTYATYEIFLFTAQLR